MVTKKNINLILDLHHKKFRKEHKLFIAEGEKIIKELINSAFELHQIYCTTDDINFNVEPSKVTTISTLDLKKMSTLKSPNNCLAVFKIPKNQELQKTELIVALDNIKDPGNLGTIIRLCDWFGISQLVCSKETVDVYNPKVVQASMGSLTRVGIYYTDLQNFISSCNMSVYGTFADGKNIYNTSLQKSGIIIMGNESNGISKNIENLITSRIAIPRFGKFQVAESLNVATACSVILSEFKRRNL